MCSCDEHHLQFFRLFSFTMFTSVLKTVLGFGERRSSSLTMLLSETDFYFVEKTMRTKEN